MMIVAFGRDTIPGKGTAPISFVSRQIMPDRLAFSGDLGSKYDWSNSRIRLFLNNNATRIMPQGVRNRVAQVQKLSQVTPNIEGNKNGEMNVTTYDTLWLLDYWGEMRTSSGMYKEVANAGDLDACWANGSTSTASNYWLRSKQPLYITNGVITTDGFHYMESTTATDAENYRLNISETGSVAKGVRFGFCLA
jgi:hypothetical protein